MDWRNCRLMEPIRWGLYLVEVVLWSDITLVSAVRGYIDNEAEPPPSWTQPERPRFS